jgi:antimicrobial peptide system SdpB family protein
MMNSFTARVRARVDGVIKEFGRESTTSPWTNVYGLARTLIAMSTLSTLALHTPAELFYPNGIRMTDYAPLPARALSLFAIVPMEYVWVAWVGGILALVLTVIGWRPRYTALLHWWVAMSVATSGAIVDGGDQIASNLALLILPLALTDPRKWHWSRAPQITTGTRREDLAVLVRGLFILVQLQMCVVYLHASVGKMRIPDWLNGTAVYYWFSHPVFGLPEFMQPLLHSVLAYPAVVIAATWGPMLLELALAAALFLPWGRRKAVLLVLGLLFHFTIFLVHGLGSFFFSMAGGLILYLVPLELVLPLGDLLPSLGPALDRLFAWVGRSRTTRVLRVPS